MTGDERTTTALREVTRLYRAAAVEILMREYRWRPEAAEQFAGMMAEEAADRARRAAELRRILRGQGERHEHGHERDRANERADTDTPTR